MGRRHLLSSLHVYTCISQIKIIPAFKSARPSKVHSLVKYLCWRVLSKPWSLMESSVVASLWRNAEKSHLMWWNPTNVQCGWHCAGSSHGFWTFKPLLFQVLANGLDNKLREDLERLKKIRAHRGLRHFWGWGQLVDPWSWGQCCSLGTNQ